MLDVERSRGVQYYSAPRPFVWHSLAEKQKNVPNAQLSARKAVRESSTCRDTGAVVLGVEEAGVNSTNACSQGGATMVEKYDRMAWKSILNRRSTMPGHKGLKISGRPQNFAELEEMIRSGRDPVLAFAEYLDELYLHKTADFFEVEPATFFDAKTRAFYAGLVEYLGHRLGIAVPPWVEKPEFFLPHPYRKSQDDTAEPEFRRRNVLFNPRHILRV